MHRQVAVCCMVFAGTISALSQPKPGDTPACWVLSGDELHAVYADGQALRSAPVARVRISEPVARHRVLCATPDGGSVIAAESQRDRFVCFGADGRPRWQWPSKGCRAVDIAESGPAYALVRHPRVGGRSMIVCLDSSTGRVLGSRYLNTDYRDIAVDEQHANVWIVGDTVSQLGMDLHKQITLKSMTWKAVSVDYTAEGSVVIAERRSGEDRLVWLTRYGATQHVARLEFSPMNLAVDRRTDEVRVCGENGESARFKLGDSCMPLEPDPGPVFTDAAPDGTWWLANTNGMVTRMSSEGAQSLSGFSGDRFCLTVSKGGPAPGVAPIDFARMPHSPLFYTGRKSTVKGASASAALAKAVVGKPAPIQQIARQQEADLASLQARPPTGLDRSSEFKLVTWRRDIREHFTELCEGRITAALYRFELYHLWRGQDQGLRRKTLQVVRTEVERVDQLVRDLFAASRSIHTEPLTPASNPVGKLIDIPPAEIAGIRIEDSWEGRPGEGGRDSYTVQKTGFFYRTSGGDRVPARKIRALAGALKGLIPTPGPLGGREAFDYSRMCELSISFKDGNFVRLRSTSISTPRNPWNVQWLNEWYVHLGPSLANAVHDVLTEVDPKHFGGSQISFSGRKGPATISLPSLQFSTKDNPSNRGALEPLLDFLYAHPAMAPYLSNRDIVGVERFLWADQKRPKTARMRVRLSLVDRTLREVHVLSFSVTERDVVPEGPSPSELSSAGTWLWKQSGLSSTLARHSGMWMRLYWDTDGRPALYRPPGGRAGDRGVELLCTYSPSMRGTFNFLPEGKELWVDGLAIELEENQRERFVDIGSLASVFDAPSGTPSPHPFLSRIDIRGSAHFWAIFKPSSVFLKAHPEYVKSMQQQHEKVLQSDFRLRIPGTPVRLSDAGRLVQ